MIKTQLCPSSELENKNWWHVDVIVLVLIAALGYVLTENYLDGVRDEISRLKDKKTHWEHELAGKQSGLEKFKSLEEEIQLLKKKVGALQKITTSKVDKVKPLVALDQLQTLWMEGVWYEQLDYSSGGALKLSASAHDPMLVGEYVLGLRETMNPATTNEDFRTQLGFDSVHLLMASLSKNGDELFPDIKKKMHFEITAQHLEKPSVPAPAASVTLGPRPRAYLPSGF